MATTTPMVTGPTLKWRWIAHDRAVDHRAVVTEQETAYGTGGRDERDVAETLLPVRGYRWTPPCPLRALNYDK